MSLKYKHSPSLPDTEAKKSGGEGLLNYKLLKGLLCPDSSTPNRQLWSESLGRDLNNFSMTL